MKRFVSDFGNDFAILGVILNSVTFFFMGLIKNRGPFLGKNNGRFFLYTRHCAVPD